jgi:hypothetical protein
MIKVWGKLLKNNHIIMDKTIDGTDIESCIEKICYSLDIPKPIWMKKNKKEITKYFKTSFLKDSFMEELDFEKFEIEIFEEEKKR